MERQIFINVEPLETRVAIVEDGKLQEIMIEREQEKTLVGNVYKGVVRNVLPAIQAAFIDVGLGRNGFLHVSDIDEVTACREIAGEDLDDLGIRRKDKRKEPIEKVLTNGQELLVQVIKEPIGSKGVRLSANISLAGRYLVMMPGANQIGISRRITNYAQRRKLRGILKQLRVPGDMGFIVRTVGLNATLEDFAKDVEYLTSLWRGIQKQIPETPAPAPVHEELNLVLRILRDSLAEDVSKIAVDSREQYGNIQRFVNTVMPKINTKIIYHKGRDHIFDHHGLQREIEKAQRRKVWLKCGGYLIIEQTEALVVIDVNSGRHLDKNNLEETILQTNLEAVEEIVRQIRLRNIGGIIIIDFIDMRLRRHQRMVEREMMKAVKRDKAKTNILPISQLGILQMTRERVKESLREAVYENCPYCKGSGEVKSPESLSIEVQRKIKLVLRSKMRLRRLFIKVQAHPTVCQRLQKEDRDAVREIEKRYKGVITFEPREGLHVETVKLYNAKTGRIINMN
jgi:ribonuclease G